MVSLELKIPPPIITLLFGILMWFIAQALPTSIALLAFKNSFSVIVLFLGMAFCLAGAITFKLAQTTINPQKPHETSSLVTSGIYRISRNPMYLGFFLVLISWGIYLSNIFTLAMTVLFVLYMNKYQIKPEERALLNLFPAEFTTYTETVRRWL